MLFEEEMKNISGMVHSMCKCPETDRTWLIPRIQRILECLKHNEGKMAVVREKHGKIERNPITQ